MAESSSTKLEFELGSHFYLRTMTQAGDLTPALSRKAITACSSVPPAPRQEKLTGLRSQTVKPTDTSLSGLKVSMKQ